MLRVAACACRISHGAEGCRTSFVKKLWNTNARGDHDTASDHIVPSLADLQAERAVELERAGVPS